jgi:hypothetical protein
MLDPFPIPPIPWLSKAVQPFADYANFPTLPLHIHEVLLSFGLYTFINIYVAPIISNALFPVRYNKLSRDRRVSWDVHVVSLFQSCTINGLALWVMFVDEERKNMDWEQRVWGYTGASGMIQGLATGYFLWDLMVTIRYVDLFGYGMLAHAISALCVFSFGFVSPQNPPSVCLCLFSDRLSTQRPFVNFYACTFILYELSSPFLNFHWFFDKLDMTGSRAQLYNGVLLLVTFFCCRLLWGTYQSVRVYQDIWSALHRPATNTTSSPLSASTPDSNVMHFTTLTSTTQYVPLYLAFLYLSSNMILNTLNFYWFGQMIEALRKRFEPAAIEAAEARRKGKMAANVDVSRTTGADGGVKVVLEETEVRRRKGVEDEDEEVLPAIS